MSGFRGGYAPFYEAVRQLTARGVFDAKEVTGTEFVTKVGARDEYHIVFPDGHYPTCTYRVDGTIITVADDSIAGLHIEQFELTGGQIRALDRTGICRLDIRYGGKYATIHTGDPKVGQQIRVNIKRIDNNHTDQRQAVHTTTTKVGTRTYVRSNAGNR